MKKIIYSLIFAINANSYTLDNPIDISIKDCGDKIQEISNKKYQDIQHSIKEYNLALEEKNIKLSANIAQTSKILQQLISNDTIDEKKEELNRLKNNLVLLEDEKNRLLKSISYKGVFYTKFIYKADFGVENTELYERAKEIISPFAIKKLNGVFIEQIRVVKNEELTKTITKNLSGTIKYENVLKQKVNRGDKTVEYIAMVSVSPLQKSALEINDTKVASEAIQINAPTDEVSSDILTQIEMYNEISKNKETKILNEYTKNRQEIQKEIKSLEYEIQSLEDKVNNIISSENIKCSDNCIDIAKDKLKEKIANLNNEIKQNIYDKVAIYSQSVVIVNSPLKELPIYVNEILKNIEQNYSKKENISYTTTITNTMMNKDNKKDNIIYKTIKEYTPYVVPNIDKNIDYDVVVLATFKPVNNNTYTEQSSENENIYIDKTTNLKWLKIATSDIDKNNYDNQLIGGKVVDFLSADKYCKSNGTNWSVPSISELKTLITNESNKNSKGFSYKIKKDLVEVMPPLSGRKPSAFFYSSDVDRFDNQKALIANFKQGFIISDDKTKKYYVLCVSK